MINVQATRRGCVSWLASLVLALSTVPASASTPGAGIAADATRSTRSRPGTASPAASLASMRLFATKTWTGTVSTDWSTAGNWSASGQPGSGDVVNIPANVVSGNYPVISGTANASTVTLQSGAGTQPTLTIQSGGTLTVASTLTVSAGTITQTGGTLNVVTTASITGTYNLSGGSYFGQSTLTVNSGGAVNVSGSGVLHMAVNIGTAPTDPIVLAANANLSLAGSGGIDTKDFTGTSGSPSSAVTQSGGTFKVYHDFKNSGTYTATAGTIEFAGAGGGANWPATTGATQFYNVLLDVDPAFAGNAAVAFSVAGDWTANAAVNMSAKATTVTFNGTGAQTIGGSSATTFANVTVNKASGTATLGISETLTGGNLSVTAGTLDLSTFTMNRSAAGGTLTVSNGATLKIGGTNTFPTNYTTHTLGASSTVEYYGTTQTVTAETYGNLSLSTSGTKTMPGSAMTVAGTFTTSGTIAATAAAIINFNGDVTLGSGTTFNASTFSHVLKGTWTNNGATFTAGTSTFTLNGASTQTITGSSRTSFNNVTLNNASGLTLVTSATIVGTMTFTSGTVSTGSNALIIGPSGSVTQTSGFVIGNLTKQITASGSVSRTFEVGTGSTYAPVTVALTGVAGQASDSTQYLTVSSTGSEHPSISGSGVNAAKSVNRYWTFTKGGAWTFTNYAATFTFVAGDVDAGATTGNFVVRRYNAGAWTTTTIGTRKATNTQATATVASGDFAIGEATATSTAVNTSATPATSGTSVTFTATTTQTGGGVVASEGTITIRDGGADCSTGSVLQAATTVNGSGVVTFSTAALSGGAHTIRACYDDSGTNLYPTSDGTVAQTINIYGPLVTPGTSTASRLPSNGTSYTTSFIIQNNGNVTDSYDFLITKLPGTYLTTVSITGTSITQGANKDSARVANMTAGALDTAVVTYSVAMAGSNSTDTLVFQARSVGSSSQSASARLNLTVIRPVIAIAKTATPSGTQPPGTDITYADTVTNNGSANASTIIALDSISTLLQFKVGSVVTSFPVSVTVEYSNDGGTTWTYTPVSGGCSATSGYDRCVNRVRARLLAPLSATGPNNTGYLTYIARIR
ncbi:MAG: hypothetical protein ABUL71_05575 [Gemmatimonadota bacterium]